MSRLLQTIRLEHYNILSVLACLRYLVREIEAGSWTPGFDLLYAVVDYIEAFPEACHHPKEETYIFTGLLRHRPECAPLVERLCDDHAKGVGLTQGLRGALDAYRDDAATFDAFKATVASYVEFQRDHMRTEERELLPLVMDALTPTDWARIDAAFAQDDDPLFGDSQEERFRALFRKILELAPAPMGFGGSPRKGGLARPPAGDRPTSAWAGRR